MARKIYLIDPKFQLRFSLYVCIVVSLSALVYPMAIYDMMENFITFVSINFPQLTEKYEEQRRNLIIFLSLWQLGFTALVFVIAIFFSHKIAGPIYKMKKYLKVIRDGETVDTIKLRKRDYFKDLAKEINQTLKFFGKIKDEDLKIEK